jgi:hypothetical protein
MHIGDELVPEPLKSKYFVLDAGRFDLRFRVIFTQRKERILGSLIALAM